MHHGPQRERSKVIAGLRTGGAKNAGCENTRCKNDGPTIVARRKNARHRQITQFARRKHALQERVELILFVQTTT